MKGIAKQCTELPVATALVTSGHLKDISHKKVSGISKYHGLSEETINRLPYILNHPAIVFDSFAENNSDAVCILSEVTDSDGLPIVVIIKPDGQGKYNDVRIDSNFILSMYGKDNPQGFLNRIGNNIDNVLFADRKRTRELLGVNRLQLPKSFNSIRFNTIIHRSRNVVKSNGVKNSNSDLSNTKNGDNKGVNDYSENKSEQHGVMWTLKDGSLSKREIAEFYSKISETKNRKYKNHVMSNDGDLIYEIGRNKLVFTDGDYDYPHISKVITFNMDDYDDIEYAKEIVYDEAEQRNQIENAFEIIEAVFGEGNIRTATYGSDEANTGNASSKKEHRGDRSRSGEINTDSRRDVRFSLDDFETQDLLMQIAEDIGYHDGLIEASKKNKQEFRGIISKNQQLSQRLENARRQMTRTTVPRANVLKVQRAVKDVIKTLQSKADAKDIGPRALEIYNTYFKELKDAGRVSELEEKALDNMVMAFQDIAADVINDAEVWTQSEDYKNLVTYLRTQPIAVSEDIKTDIHYAEFRKAHMGTLNLANAGLPVDVVYAEICEMFPHLFSDEIINPADQLIEIADVVEKIKPQKYNPYDAYADDAINFAVEQFISDVDSLLESPTKADKMAEMAEYKKENALEKQREAFEKKYEKLRKQAEDYKNEAARKAEEQKYIRFWENKLSSAEKSADVKRIREAAVRRYDKLKIDKNNVINNIRERQKIRILKASIRNTANDFKRRLLNPSDSHTMPAELIKSIADVCSKLDFTTDRSGKNGGENQSNLRLLELKNKYDELKRDPDYDLSSEYDEELSERISELDKLLGSKKIANLGVEELGELDGILKQIRHTLQTANVQLGKEKAALNKELGAKVIAEMNAQKGFNRNAAARLITPMLSEVLNPMRIARMISNYDEKSATYSLFKDLNDGLRKHDRLVMKMQKPFDVLIRGKGNRRLYHEFRTKLVNTGIKFTDDTDVKLPKSMICELIMLWDRKQGRTHLEKGGFTVPEFKNYNKGKIAEAFTTGQKTVANVTEKDITRLKNTLDKYDKLWIKQAKEFFNGTAKDAVNETSMILKGRKLAEVENYIPIHTDKNYVRTEIEGVKLDASIEGSGSLKKTVKNASQPVYLMGLSHTVQEHIEFAAKYAGLAIPIRNFNKIYNVTVVGENNSRDSVKNAIGQKWGSEIRSRVVEQLIRDLQTSRSHPNDVMSKTLSSIQSNWVAATLNANISVCIKQAASLPTAAYIVGTKVLGKALGTHMNTKKLLNEIDAHTGIHYKRRLGLSIQELGDQAEANTIIGRITDRLRHKRVELAWFSE